MDITDFETDCGTGLCATTEINGEEFILSQIFDGGVYEVKVQVDKIVHEIKTVPTIAIRFITIQHALEVEMKDNLLQGYAGQTRICLERNYGISTELSTEFADMAFSLLLSLAQMTMGDE